MDNVKGDVKLDIVYQTVTQDIPALGKLLERIQ